jgi:hypothetical protein
MIMENAAAISATGEVQVSLGRSNFGFRVETSRAGQTGMRLRTRFAAGDREAFESGCRKATRQFYCLDIPASSDEIPIAVSKGQPMCRPRLPNALRSLEL